MRKKQPLSDEDKALFANAMAGVTPLSPHYQNTKIAVVKSVRKNEARSKAAIAQAVNEKQLYQHQLDLLSAETPLYFARSGVQSQIMRQLQQRGDDVDAILDLHGFTIAQAYPALQQLLLAAAEQRWRYLCIIHGKSGGAEGFPVLKNRLNHWLRDEPNVLGFCSATSRRGGSGAVIVLMSRKE